MLHEYAAEPIAESLCARTGTASAFGPGTIRKGASGYRSGATAYATGSPGYSEPPSALRTD